MSSYTIQILNNSGASRSYFAFMAPPVVKSSGGDPVVYTNAWVTFQSITNGGYDVITVSGDTYAYWGTTQGDLRPGARFDSGGVARVNPGAGDSLAFTSGAPTGFGPASRPVTAAAGGVSIVAGADFTPEHGYALGLAAPGRTPAPTPVATFAARPEAIYEITPSLRFHVAEGDYFPGEVIDLAVLSANMATIDFTGILNTTATAIQGGDGGWTVVYS